MISKYTMYVDAACQGNPGPSGVGVVIYKDGKELINFSKFYDNRTNNEAEYLSLIDGVKLIKSNGLATSHVDIFMDSKLVVEQVNERWSVKAENLKPYFDYITSKLRSLSSYTLMHVRREYNKRADELSRINERQ